jgi:hypothetical protein
MTRTHAVALAGAVLVACSGSSSSSPPTPARHVSELPAPTVSGLDRTGICAAQTGQVFRVLGTGFLTVAGAVPTVTIGAFSNADFASVVPGGCVPVAGPFAEGAVESCTELAVGIPAGLLAVGSQPVAVTNPGAVVAAATTPTLHINSSPILFHAEPEVIYRGLATAVTFRATSLALDVGVTLHGVTTTPVPFTAVGDAGHPTRGQFVVDAARLPAGAYDLQVADANGCAGVLPNAFTVTDATTMALQVVLSSSAWSGGEAALTIKGTGGASLLATPFVFLQTSAATTPAIELTQVAVQDASTATAIVPAGLPVGTYDLVVANPDGAVGISTNAVLVSASPPPMVTSTVPASIAAASGQHVVVTGRDVNGVESAWCSSPAGGGATPTVTAGTASCTGSACTLPVTIDGSALTAGMVCLLRVTGLDGAWTTSSGLGVTGAVANLAADTAGAGSLTKGRRALVAAAGTAAPASRFLYAIGGDGGSAVASSPFADVEVAPVADGGAVGAWRALPTASLSSARAFAASATLGRYVYVFGGTNGSTTLASAERAMILDPAEVPSAAAGELVLASTGLDAGSWRYRVSALFSASSPENPGGESLPSSEVLVRLRSVAGKKVQVQLTWSPPTDALGIPLPDVAGYRVYRTPAVNGAPGTEALLATAGPGVRAYLDDGQGIPQVAKTPLAPGALGRWAPLPSMGTARQAHAGAVTFDPAHAASAYVYALLGSSGASDLSSYELLPVTVSPNGHQTVGTAWKPGPALGAPPTARSQLGAFVEDRSVWSAWSGTTYVYLAGGVTSGTTMSSALDVATLGADGALAFTVAERAWTANRAGYGACAADGKLYAFGGGGAAPTQAASSATLDTSTPPVPGTWNPEGLSLSAARYLSGTTTVGPFVFLVGGASGTGAASTVETALW